MRLISPAKSMGEMLMAVIENYGVAGAVVGMSVRFHERT